MNETGSEQCMRESINKMLQQVKDGVTPWQAAQEVRVRQPRNHARRDKSTRVRSAINSVRPLGEECWFTPKEGHPDNRSELRHWQNANLNDTKEGDGQDRIIEFIHARPKRLKNTLVDHLVTSLFISQAGVDHPNRLYREGWSV